MQEDVSIFLKRLKGNNFCVNRYEIIWYLNI